MKPITDMTPEEMDAFASQVYATLVVAEQAAEAKAVYRLGEFIRELGRRLGGPFGQVPYICETGEAQTQENLETIQKIEGYMADRYGLTLPDDHPFKIRSN